MANVRSLDAAAAQLSEHALLRILSSDHVEVGSHHVYKERSAFLFSSCGSAAASSIIVITLTLRRSTQKWTSGMSWQRGWMQTWQHGPAAWRHS